MSGFKLLAIIPLTGCNVKFRKNLEVGFLYQFYKEYDILLNEDKSSVISVKVNNYNIDAENLYSLENGIFLNFSAVAGKNGTGKSTIFELLYYLIYVLCTQKNINQKKIINTISQDLEGEKKWIESDYHLLKNSVEIENKIEKKEKLNEFELSFLSDDFEDLDIFTIKLIQKHNLRIPERELKVKNKKYNFILTELLFKIDSLEELIKKEKQEFEPLISSELNLSVLYECNGIVKEIEYIKGEFSFQEFNTEKTRNTISIDDYELSNFFYSISLNYSHHGLNSNTLGLWIKKLFHKNDAYTTPVVINPMRDEGNFDINHEMRLSKERLMSNLIFDLVNGKQNRLLGKYKVAKFIFTPKIIAPIPLDFTADFINNLNSNFIFKTELKINNLDDYINYWDFAIAYLGKKIRKIEDNYNFLIPENESIFETSSELHHFILTDGSHVTKKIRQVINFLKATYEKKNREFWMMPSDGVKIELTPKKMKEWLDKFNLDYDIIKPAKLIEYALPGFFNIDFELEDDKENKIDFGKLSSGEQQMIFNINSISYHLYNIQSVHFPITEIDNIDSKYPKRERERVKYNNVNIILDEVELYYHPEMQRILVKNLMDSFENIKNKGEQGINSINVCFLTHSPFILSDIPKQNILLLDINDDKSYPIISKTETFGANIHDLLANDFFLKNGFIGEFARNYIINLFEELYKLNENTGKLISNKEYVILLNKITLIGERIIRVRLEDLLNEIPREKTIEDIEIENLSKRLKELKRNRR